MPHAEPHTILRTYGSTKMCPKMKRPSAEGGENIFPSAGTETTNHSKGKPESEWSITSVAGLFGIKCNGLETFPSDEFPNTTT